MFVYSTYAKFSLDDTWKLFQEDLLPNNTSNLFRQMINRMKAWNYLQKTLGLPLNFKIIKQAHGLMMVDEKDVLVGEYRRSPVFAGYHIFALASHIERYAISRFH